MHISHTYDTEYYIEQDSRRWKLETVQEEKDFEIITTNDLKFSKQCNEVAKKAMNVPGVLRLTKRHFFKLNIPTFKILYKSFFRSHSIQAWSPYLWKDIDVLEKIKQRATKLVIGMKHVLYEERLVDYGALA